MIISNNLTIRMKIYSYEQLFLKIPNSADFIFQFSSAGPSSSQNSLKYKKLFPQRNIPVLPHIAAKKLVEQF